MTEQPRPAGAVFLSYASQDADAAARICEALRAAGVEVWFDRSELRGGDAWDSQIKKQIHDCALFLPIISAHTNARTEGYFRREWKLATRRLLDIADDAAFLVPVVVDETHDADARVPEEFLHVHWTRLPGGETPSAFAQRVRQLLGLDPTPAPTAKSAATGVINPSARSPGSVRPPLVRRYGLPLIALLLVLGGALFWYFQGARDTPAGKPVVATAPSVAIVASNEKSIAVLPFTDMSAEKNQEYMADGIAEELLNLLAQAPDLNVIARTSSFAFKGQNVEIAEIAKKLNVAHVLEGSVRTSGDKLRITAQLVRTSDSTHVWSEHYDRQVDDIFAVQDEIAKAIVQALQIRLSGGILNRRAGGTQNFEAYQLYLRAVSESYQATKASWEASEDYANQAIKLDPNYGLAWMHLAYGAAYRLAMGHLSTKEGYEKVEQLTKHALQLSPDLAEAHAMLHSLYIIRDQNWPAGRAELQRALAIDPTNTTVLLSAASVSGVLGDYDEAERQFRAVMLRDPLDFSLNEQLASVYYKTGRLAEAEDLIRTVLDHQPDSEWTRSFLAKVLLLQGKVEAALAELKHEPNEGAQIATLPMLLYAAGRRAEADAALKKQTEYWADECAQCIAKTYAYIGDHDRAMNWLERAYQQKDSSLTTIVGDPLYGKLPDDPRFKAFLRTRLKLPS